MGEWFSEDGLMRLDLNDDQAPHQGQTLRTVKNANGIYYLAIYHLLMHKLGHGDSKDREWIFEVISRLEVKPGLFLRRPGAVSETEAHDNYLGIIILSTIYNIEFSKQICAYGMMNGFNYDHTGKNNVTTQRQGSDVATYMVAAKYYPTFIDWLWLCGNILVSAFFKSSNTISDKQLTWVRCELIDMCLSHKKYGLWMTAPYWICSQIFRIMIKKRFGGISKVLQAFFSQPNHPIAELSKELE